MFKTKQDCTRHVKTQHSETTRRVDGSMSVEAVPEVVGDRLMQSTSKASEFRLKLEDCSANTNAEVEYHIVVKSDLSEEDVDPLDLQ